MLIKLGKICSGSYVNWNPTTIQYNLKSLLRSACKIQDTIHPVYHRCRNAHIFQYILSPLSSLDDPCYSHCKSLGFKKIAIARLASLLDYH
jgi:hypothetical protein